MKKNSLLKVGAAVMMLSIGMSSMASAAIEVSTDVYSKPFDYTAESYIENLDSICQMTQQTELKTGAESKINDTLSEVIVSGDGMADLEVIYDNDGMLCGVTSELNLGIENLATAYEEGQALGIAIAAAYTGMILIDPANLQDQEMLTTMQSEVTDLANVVMGVFDGSLTGEQMHELDLSAAKTLVYTDISDDAVSVKYVYVAK